MRLFVFLGALGLALLFAVVQKADHGTSGPAKKKSAQAVAVEVEAVTIEPIRELVVLTGSLESEAVFTVASKVGGRLETLRFEGGDRIRRGDLVAELEDEEYVQQVEQVKAEVAVAKARVQASKVVQGYAKRELDRVQALADRNLVADTDLDAGRGKVEQVRADAAVNSYLQAEKEAALRAAEVRLAYTKVHALWRDDPVERVVGQRFAEAGALLSPGAPLISVMTLDPLRAVIFVIERDYARVTPGQAAEVSTDAYPDETFSGVVQRVAPLLQESSRQARVEVRVKNPKRQLRPGMFARVKLELDRNDRATVIPRGVLIHRNGEPGVFLINRATNTAELLSIKTGIIAGNRVEVTSPALEGEVVTIGHHLLSDGGAVRVVKAKGSTS